jgi:hypothetical protein
MRKFVPYFNTYTPIFYLKNFDHRRPFLTSSNSKQFENYLKKHYAASGPPVSLLFPYQAPLACPITVWNSAAAFPYQRRAAPLVPVRAPTLEPHRERFPGYKTPSPHRPPFLFSQWSNARLRPSRHAGEEASRGWAGQAAPDSLAVGLRAKFGPTAGFIFLYIFEFF